MSQYNQSTYYIAEVFTKYTINIDRTKVHPWRHKVNWEMPPRSDQTPRCVAPLEPPVLLLWRGCETARVSSHMIIAQQVVWKPLGMNSPKVGVHVVCKADQQ
jgi:hypothetical protein